MTEENSTMFFVGCTLSYSYPRVAEIMTRIFDEFGIEYKIFDDEPCCGGILFKIGQINEAENKAKQNFEYFKNHNIKRIITNCPECYLTFKQEYQTIIPDFNNEIEVLHYTTVLANLIREGKIIFSKEVPIKATYHDPCELGRHSGIYEDPRFIIESIPGIKFTELKRQLEYAQCCGGPIRIPFIELRNVLAQAVLKEAKKKLSNNHLSCLLL